MSVTQENKVGGRVEESGLENVELQQSLSGSASGSDNENKESKTLSKKYSLFLDKLEDFWILDLTCIILSGLGLVGMAIFLFHFDGEPAPNWSHTFGHLSSTKKAARITFNAILELFSRFSTIFFTYILTRSLGQLTWIWFTKRDRQLTDFSLFHQALARHEMGALKLIWKLKAKHFAVVGALVALGIHQYGFFVQQLVSTSIGYIYVPSLNEPLPQIPSNWENLLDQEFQNYNRTGVFNVPEKLQIARISNVTNYTYPNYGQPPYYSVDLTMKGNIWASLYNSDPNGNWAIPEYYCSTGNCTWFNYKSLGVCSRCADISSQIIKSCTPMPGLDLANNTGCDILLPNGFGLGGPERLRTNVMAMSTDYNPLVYTNYSDPLAVVQSIVAYNNTLFVTNGTPINATECVLIPCVLSYDADTSGLSNITTLLGNNEPLFDEIALQIWDNYTFNTSAFPWNGPTIRIPNDGNIYKMAQPAYVALKYYLKSLFNGFIYTNGQSLFPISDNITRPVTVNNIDAMQSVYYASSGGCYDVFGNILYDWTSCTILPLSIAITQTIRGMNWDPFDFNTAYAIGYTMYPKPIIDVAWLWGIPVVALWVASVILLAGTIWKTRRLGVKNMGFDPLSLIFLNIDDENVESDAYWWHSANKTKERAAQINVQLAQTERKASLVPR